jgi:hypothetical protein
MTPNSHEVKVNMSRYRHAGDKGGQDTQLLLILDLGTRWGERSASRPGRALTPGKGPPEPTGKRLVWTHRLEENALPLSRIEPRPTSL